MQIDYYNGQRNIPAELIQETKERCFTNPTTKFPIRGHFFFVIKDSRVVGFLHGKTKDNIFHIKSVATANGPPSVTLQRLLTMVKRSIRTHLPVQDIVMG